MGYAEHLIQWGGFDDCGASNLANDGGGGELIMVCVLLPPAVWSVPRPSAPKSITPENL